MIRHNLEREYIMAELSNVTPWPERIMENYQWLDGCLQKQPSTEKEFQPAWQAYKYLLCGKMYAYIGIDDRNRRPIVTLKLEPAFSDMLRSKYEDIVPGYYMNKIHWSTVYLDGNVPQDVLADIVHASYQLVRSSLSQKDAAGITGKARPARGLIAELKNKTWINIT